MLSVGGKARELRRYIAAIAPPLPLLHTKLFVVKYESLSRMQPVVEVNQRPSVLDYHGVLTYSMFVTPFKCSVYTHRGPPQPP